MKTSLAPGSKVVTVYLSDAGLLPYLEQLGYHVVAYGCTTCMGNAGPLDEAIEDAVVKNDIIACAVLSGQPQFRSARAPEPESKLPHEPAARRGVRARRHRAHRRGPAIRSAPARTASRCSSKTSGRATQRSRRCCSFANDAEKFRREYGDLAGAKELWDAIPESKGATFDYDPAVHLHPGAAVLRGLRSRSAGTVKDVKGARALGIYGDSLTTDHISPVAPIKPLRPPAAGCRSTRRAR